MFGEQETDARIGGGGDLSFGIFDGGVGAEAGEGHLHVALAGGEPDVSDQEVGALDARSVAGDRQCVRPAGGLGGEIRGPFAEAVGLGGDRLRVELEGKPGAGGSPAPEVNGAVALEDGVVGEDGGKADLSCAGYGCEQEREEQCGRPEDAVHGVIS